MKIEQKFSHKTEISPGLFEHHFGILVDDKPTEITRVYSTIGDATEGPNEMRFEDEKFVMTAPNTVGFEKWIALHIKSIDTASSTNV